jgi:hypothetical protein
METENYYLGLIKLEKINGFNLSIKVHMCFNCGYIEFSLFNRSIQLIAYLKNKM